MSRPELARYLTELIEAPFMFGAIFTHFSARAYWDGRLGPYRWWGFMYERGYFSDAYYLPGGVALLRRARLLIGIAFCVFLVGTYLESHL